MTEGHKHRMIRIKRGSLIQRLLQKPIPFYRLSEDKHFERVERSPYPYSIEGYDYDSIAPVPLENEVYYLSWLAFLHRWTGLTLYFHKE